MEQRMPLDNHYKLEGSINLKLDGGSYAIRMQRHS